MVATPSDATRRRARRVHSRRLRSTAAEHVARVNRAPRRRSTLRTDGSAPFHHDPWSSNPVAVSDHPAERRGGSERRQLCRFFGRAGVYRVARERQSGGAERRPRGRRRRRPVVASLAPHRHRRLRALPQRTKWRPGRPNLTGCTCKYTCMMPFESRAFRGCVIQERCTILVALLVLVHVYKPPATVGHVALLVRLSSLREWHHTGAPCVHFRRLASCSRGILPGGGRCTERRRVLVLRRRHHGTDTRHLWIRT